MKQPKNDDSSSSNVHVRLSRKDIAILDCCAKIKGISRSAYVRNLVLSHISHEMGEMSISNTEKTIRKTLEDIIDIKTKKEAQTLRTLVNEIQRSNFMQLKNYIEQHPGLDPSEYKAYYNQTKREAFEISSGRKSFSSLCTESTSANSDPDWLKILSGNDEEV